MSLRRRSRAAVVMTVSFRSSYTDAEELAFRHAREYLGAHDMYVAMPRSHRGVYPGLRSVKFPDRFFGSGKAHAALLLSERFYRAFQDYEYVLIHHLDAIALRDSLEEWCDAGYDYIGAPWLVCPDTPHITAEKVGNGGFSLRKVSSFLRAFQSREYFVDPDEYWQRYAERTAPVIRALNSPRRLLKRIHVLNDIHWHIRWALDGDVHEDRFWAEYATHYDPSFRIAPVDAAMRFAFEAEPRRCFEQIGRQLPFGAHRWQKFDPAFFEPYLLRTGLGSGVRVDTVEASPVRDQRLGVAHR